MTIEELIEFLKTLPNPRAVAVVRCGYGGFIELTPEHIAPYDFAGDRNEPTVELGE